MAQCLISFGSNLGDRDQRIVAAARMIQAEPLVQNFAASRLFETPPIGGPGGQEPFLNAVAAFDTESSAADILNLLQEIENKLGRLRKERWGARSIDLDVVLHGELIGGRTGLVVPHPRYTARRFVVQPACDVAGHYRDPRFGWTLNQLAKHMEQGVPSMAIVGGSEANRGELCQRLREEYQLTIFNAKPIPEAMRVVGNAPAPNQTELKSPASENIIDASLIKPNEPWLSAFVPKLPKIDSHESTLASTPRLIARIQKTTAETRWPAPHQMWPASWDWPEYRLELDDLDWATGEVMSAFESMRCPIQPVTENGEWWN
ncbi:2-amino-4-hydroxy-6-hydroxymethyldihydropteridine pyrophosphokinase [Rubripirellula amarantea]|uniref:2-amino-4-hydroxy-6-hydroxymethyldihydropteridine pyrophosphokinase n=1 Tax=Rubripirellula amarantea TaxID=2527999 RepID=A0A5C5WUV8_9BACT|nr:2-amino-4-hydroxy-6-hydroxymethyldihydropteridine diphosphokinase [Rubripirellula amarantea]TWT53881.1 2-amino-4-hydroxy-6-hydroxymethyldihydropteridine pyrophosphokinase [Rubripirellula amarantea]